MASLKEIRGRINSVTNTRKITNAMKMVSSAKLHKAQERVIHYHPYWARMRRMFDSLLNGNGDIEEIELLSERHEIKRVAIVAFSSNSSLCGSFNNSVQKRLNETLSKEYGSLAQRDISLYLIGKKIYENISKRPSEYRIKGPFFNIAHKPDRIAIDQICDELMELFLSKEIDKVDIIYNRFKSTSIQIIRQETLLPIVKNIGKHSDQNGGEHSERHNNQKWRDNYIVEPDVQQFLMTMVPDILHLQLYGALLNSYASEHGARTTAMQTATDNADELIENLVLEYNKFRQNAITKEIIDIIGGSEVMR